MPWCECIFIHLARHCSLSFWKHVALRKNILQIFYRKIHPFYFLFLEFLLFNICHLILLPFVLCFPSHCLFVSFSGWFPSSILFLKTHIGYFQNFCIIFFNWSPNAIYESILFLLMDKLLYEFSLKTLLFLSLSSLCIVSISYTFFFFSPLFFFLFYSSFFFFFLF